MHKKELCKHEHKINIEVTGFGLMEYLYVETIVFPLFPVGVVEA